MTADTELLYVHSLSQLREENKRLREQCRALWKLLSRERQGFHGELTMKF